MIGYTNGKVTTYQMYQQPVIYRYAFRCQLINADTQTDIEPDKEHV